MFCASKVLGLERMSRSTQLYTTTPLEMLTPSAAAHVVSGFNISGQIEFQSEQMHHELDVSTNEGRNVCCGSSG